MWRLLDLLPERGHASLDIFKEQLSILSEPDVNLFERLASEQDIADATPESKLIDIDEEDKIDIFLVTLSSILLCKLFIFIWFFD